MHLDSAFQRRSLLQLALSFTLLGISYVLVRSMGVAEFGTIDFSQYWCATKLFLEGSNPYDRLSLFELQRTVIPIKSPEDTVLMWNPPILLTLTFWLGFLDFRSAHAAWLLSSIVLFVLSIRYSLLALGRRQPFSLRRDYLMIAFVLTFYPLASMLHLGQVGVFFLFPFSLFLYFSSKGGKSTLWAGFFLSLTLIKPHLLYLLYLFVGLEALLKRDFRFIAGGVLGAMVLALPPLLIQPDIYLTYSLAAGTPPIYWQTPTLGSWLQGLTGSHTLMVRALPTLITTGFFLLFFLYSKRFERIEDRASILYLLVPWSLLTSPFGWLFDHVLLVPGTLWIIYRSGGSTLLKVLPIVANLGVLIIPKGYGFQIYVWYPLVFALLHLYLTRAPKESKESDPY